MVTVPTLNLVCESKICDLIPCDHPTERWDHIFDIPVGMADARNI